MMPVIDLEVARVAAREAEGAVQKMVEPLSVEIRKVRAEATSLRMEMKAMEARLLAAIAALKEDG